MKRKRVDQSEAATNTVNRTTHAPPPLSPPKSGIPLSELPIVFRRVVAVAGDEMVSSQPSDEPFRIEKGHFWLLADNLAVPAEEAIDSRTIGPVHKNYIFERALYVVRSEEDHGPIRSSFTARVQDAGVLAVECKDVEDIIKRMVEVIKSHRS
ncbi:unnamed protein product [Closterium sp. Naga37s-1]|nr:unnamed protein product [Closterium sp. Naga37s-1]